MSGNSDASADAGAGADAGTGTSPGTTTGPIFETEAAMLHHLVETMGMPKAMIDTLTTQQKAAMFAMSKSRAILTQAHERIDHEEEWKHCVDKEDGDNYEYSYSWKNTRDDVFMKIHPSPALGSPKGERTIFCKIQKDHLRIWSTWSNPDVDSSVIVDRQLFQSVNVKESTWKVVTQDVGGIDKVEVSLRKEKSPMRWLAPYR